MAKDKSIFNLQGTLQGVTFVDSKRYGKHARAERGTHKTAVLNEVFEESAKSMVSANTPAKIIKDAVNPFIRNFYDGSLWSRLVSNFKKGADKKQSPDFLSLVEFEIHQENPLRRITDFEVTASVDYDRATIDLTIQNKREAVFRNKNLDGLIITVIGLYPNLESKSAETYERTLPPIPLKPGPTLQVTLPIPKKSKVVLVCLKVEGCEKGEISTVLKTKGMKIVKGIELTEID